MSLMYATPKYVCSVEKMELTGTPIISAFWRSMLRNRCGVSAE